MNNSILIIILLFIIFLYNIYLTHRINKIKNTEKFTDLSANQINVITNLSPHLLAIKNLSDLATSLMNGKLTIPGGLQINGDLTVNGKTEVGGDVNIIGKSTLNNDTTIGTNILIKGTSTVNGNSNIGGHTTIGGNSSVNGTSTVNNDLLIQGNSKLNKSLTVGSMVLDNDKLFDLMNVQVGFCNRGGCDCGWGPVTVPFPIPFKKTIPIVFTSLTESKSWANAWGTGGSSVVINQNKVTLKDFVVSGSTSNGATCFYWIAICSSNLMSNLVIK